MRVVRGVSVRDCCLIVRKIPSQIFKVKIFSDFNNFKTTLRQPKVHMGIYVCRFIRFCLKLLFLQILIEHYIIHVGTQLSIHPDHFFVPLIAFVTLGTTASASVPSSSAAASAAASVSFVPVAILSISIFCPPIDGFPVRLLLVTSNEFK